MWWQKKSTPNRQHQPPRRKVVRQTRNWPLKKPKGVQMNLSKRCFRKISRRLTWVLAKQIINTMTTIMMRRLCLMKISRQSWSDACITMRLHQRHRTPLICLKILSERKRRLIQALALKAPLRSNLPVALLTYMSHPSPTLTRARHLPCNGNSLLKPLQQRRSRKHRSSKEALSTNSSELTSLSQQKLRTNHRRTDHRRPTKIRLILMLKLRQR